LWHQLNIQRKQLFFADIDAKRAGEQREPRARRSMSPDARRLSSGLHRCNNPDGFSGE